MTTSDIEAHIQDIYGISVSDSTVSRITDKILPIAHEWQQRPLEPIYAVVFLDAIHYHVRSEGQIVKKAVYIAIGINLDGRKDVLGMWVGENESAKFWATVLNGLKNRGVEDIFIACTDNLTSIEGLEKTNNEIRGLQDGYQRGYKTPKALREMGMKDVGFGMTVQDKNAPDLVPLYKISNEMDMEFATASLHNSFYFVEAQTVDKSESTVVFYKEKRISMSNI